MVPRIREMAWEVNGINTEGEIVLKTMKSGEEWKRRISVLFILSVL